MKAGPFESVTVWSWGAYERHINLALVYRSASIADKLPCLCKWAMLQGREELVLGDATGTVTSISMHVGEAMRGSLFMHS